MDSFLVKVWLGAVRARVSHQTNKSSFAWSRQTYDVYKRDVVLSKLTAPTSVPVRWPRPYLQRRRCPPRLTRSKQNQGSQGVDNQHRALFERDIFLHAERQREAHATIYCAQAPSPVGDLVQATRLPKSNFGRKPGPARDDGSAAFDTPAPPGRFFCIRVRLR